MSKKIKYHIKNIKRNGETYQVRFFTCPFCGRYQIDDEGNYKCWTCEDGKLKKIPKWRTANQLKWKKHVGGG